jgi:hypothetical protein
MARKTCNHLFFPSLRAKLATKNFYECPRCCIRLHICEIEEVRAALVHRGGIFESRTKAREAEERFDNSERLAHGALVKRWRLAKIGLYNDLCVFEELRVEGDSRMRWSLELDKAFELWEEVKYDCCSVPGYVHTQEVAEDVESENESEKVQPVDHSPKQGMFSYSKTHLVG